MKQMIDVWLQKRLLGAFVLLALGVIFIPEWFNGEGYNYRHNNVVDIPEAPPLPERIEEVKQRIEALPEVVVREKEKADKTLSVAPHIAWALQVGSFKALENANQLRDEFRAKGYKTYVKTIERNGETQYKVRIGPELEQSRIKEIKQEVLKKTKVEGLIIQQSEK